MYPSRRRSSPRWAASKPSTRTRAGGRVDETEQRLHQRRLAGAVRAEQPDRRRLERDAHVVERHDVAVADGQTLGRDRVGDAGHRVSVPRRSQTSVGGGAERSTCVTSAVEPSSASAASGVVASTITCWRVAASAISPASAVRRGASQWPSTSSSRIGGRILAAEQPRELEALHEVHELARAEAEIVERDGRRALGPVHDDAQVGRHAHLAVAALGRAVERARERAVQVRGDVAVGRGRGLGEGIGRDRQHLVRPLEPGGAILGRRELLGQHRRVGEPGRERLELRREARRRARAHRARGRRRSRRSARAPRPSRAARPDARSSIASVAQRPRVAPGEQPGVLGGELSRGRRRATGAAPRAGGASR